MELPKEEHRLPANYLSENEVELLLNQTDVKTPLGIRDRAILETLYSSAIRRNELLNLSVYDVDRNRRLLTIRQGKGKRDRVVPIGVRALEWLENLDRKIERRKIALMSRALTSDEAVCHFDNTMLRHSLPASGTSRNQNTAADRDATSGRLSAWSGGRDASLHWPPSHVDKRRGDACTVVFMLVSTRIPCGRATW